MGWLLSGLLLLVGLVVLLVLVVALVGRLRRGQAAVVALRAILDDGSARLRVGQGLVREWRDTRGGTRLSGPSA
ncbi:MAG: hypothetical protein ACR2G2_01320 [Pseudonocardia sp.]